MACTASRVPLFRTLAVRGYACEPAAAVAAKSQGLQTTTLPNKLIVTSQETGSAVSRVSIAFRAGARNETYESQGAAHLLRIAAGLSTKKATGFGLTRSIQQLGGSLSVTADREIISYTIEVTRDKLDAALRCLENAVVGQTFKPWEIQDSLPRLKTELASISDQVKAVELLHRAAYRSGLGNSLYCPEYQVGKISSETMQHFYSANCTTNRTAVVGLNIDHQMLSGFAQSLALESGDGSKNESKYRGGTDGRLEKGGSTTSVAIGTNGGSWAGDAIAFSILQYAAGVNPACKRGASNGAYTKAIQAVAPNSTSTTLNATYSDNGLFGFIVSGPSKEIGQAIEAGIKAMKCGSISEDDIKRGKNQLKVAMASVYDTESEMIESLVGQSLTVGTSWTLNSVMESIDAVSTADVQTAAKKLSAERLTVAAVGNLENVPYAADLN